MLIVYADLNVWESEVKQFGDATPEVRDIMCSAVDSYYRNKPSKRDDYSGLFAQTLMLLAQERV